MKARKHFVILENPRDEETTTKSGLIITTQFDKQDGYGMVSRIVCVGDEVKDLKPGDTVLFNYYDCTPFEYENGRYLVLKAEAVMGLIPAKGGVIPTPLDKSEKVVA